jgi:serine/threonine-protein kinase ULK4
MDCVSQASRGTPAYMAPELFQEGATQSTASDLWALGCVLYECFIGRPPFMNASFSELVRLILHTEYASMPDASPEFENLINRLLDKNPATRMTWAEMLTHPFWRFTLVPTQMPPEPALERYIEKHNLRPKIPENGRGTNLEGHKASERAKLCVPHSPM